MLILYVEDTIIKGAKANMERKFKVLTKIILLISIFSIFIVNEILDKSFATDSEDVQINITQKSKVDIVLAKARSKTDVASFKEDMRVALQNVGIDPSDVRITAVQAQRVNLETSFQWEKDVASYIGSIAITNNGQNVEMRGNTTNPGKNAIWIIPEGNQEQKFRFNYSISFGDSFKAAGMLLRVKRAGNVLTGYMLSFNKPGEDFYSSSGSNNGAIWKFTHTIGTNSSNMSKTLVKGININQSGTLEVTATDAEIIISGGGMGSSVIYEIPDNDQTIGNGFGFFSDHYSHDCYDIGSFSLSNINLEATAVRSFNEILREPDWRNGSYRFLVNVHDTESEELKSNTASAELLTRLLNEDIYFVGWGKEKNMTQFNNLIESNNVNGKFINNTAYATSVTETAKYIRSVIGNKGPTNTIIVNEPISISVTPSGIDRNTIDSNWLYGKWKINHDYAYYENDIGQFAESGKYINNLITSFNKTGKYAIQYKDFSITPQEIFVHRKPVAQIEMQVSGTQVTLNSASYDLDQRSQNNGIAEEVWKWKDSTSNTWNNGKLTTIDRSKVYVVQLKVKDFQGKWSTTDSRYITADLSASPVAKYDIVSETTTKYENLQVNNYSYDPAGRNITSNLWEVYKDGNKIYTGATPKINYLNDGLGTYRMYLTVTNSSNIVSERYARTFEIVDDTMPPEVLATPITSDWARSATVNVKFTDRGGSLFRGYKYAITDSQEIPTAWSNEIAKVEDNIVINTEGEKYLHIIAYDNANNVSDDRIVGPYKIDLSGPTINVSGDFNTITTDGVIVDINTIDSLSGLKTVSVNGQTLTNLVDNRIKINNNGTYVIRAEDNTRNETAKEINVTNVYRNCDAGLEHPIYSSDYDSCQICNLIEGLEVTKSNEIYNATQRQVTYNNPRGGRIVEYYNGIAQRPINADSYQYDLKVVYENVEYNTGKTGVFQITKKLITVQDIVAENRQYDGTNEVALLRATLVGVEGTDQVNLNLPPLGTINNKNIGNYNVTVPEITLTGEKSNNYQLIQPAEDAVKVEITVRKLNITELQATKRQYNKRKEVEVTGGKLNNLLEGNEDGIEFRLNGGLIRNEEVGEQIVDINNIDLTNNQIGNYILIHPEPITVQIAPKEITIEKIEAEDRQYNGTNIVKIGKGELVGLEQEDEVGFIIPEAGTTENKDIGEYNVAISKITLTGERANNYQLTHPSEDAVKVRITERELNITELQATKRQYNKRKEVEVTGGKLNNLLEGNGDGIEFRLNGGLIRNEEVGEQTVDINNIELTNNQIGNYALTHPEPITVQISPKEITIEKIEAEDRQYDGTNIVGIGKGELVGLEQEDEVEFILPETGTTENKDIGEYNVAISQIELTGERANNYQLTHPSEDAIKVNILQRELTITGLKGKERQYDKTNIVEIEGGELPNVVGEEDVQPIIPKTGIIQNSDIGTWEVEIEKVEIEGEDSYNYALVQPESKDILVTISKPSKPSLNVESFISKVNDKEIKDIIRYNDKIEITIRVHNKGIGNGYAEKITNTIPKGMKFIADDTINKENGWKEIDEQTVVTEKLNFASGIENEIKGIEEEKTDYRDVSLVLEVVETQKLENALQNMVVIEQVDIRKENIEFEDEGNKNVLPITVNYSDLVIEKSLKKIVEIRNNEQLEHWVLPQDEKFSKIEIHAKKMDTTKVKIIYKIAVTNQGNVTSKVDKVVDYLPKKVQISATDNPEWLQGADNTLICETFGEIEPNKTVEKEVAIYGEASELVGTKTNEAVLFSSDDISQRILEKESRKKLTISNINKKILKTNNYSKAELIVTVRTGEEKNDNIIYLYIIICSAIAGSVVIVLLLNRTYSA